jgi:hypothetical protein
MSTRMMRKEVVTLEERRRGVIAELDSAVAPAGYASYEEAHTALHLEPRGIRPLLRRVGGVLHLAPVEVASPADSAPAVLPLKPAIAARVQVKEVELKALDRRINSYRVEVHKKFAIPVACIVFVLIGAPLGILARRGGFSIGFMSVAFFLFYYVCLIGGEQLADRSILPPWLAMWLANAVLGLLGIIFTLRATEVSLVPRRLPRAAASGAGRTGAPSAPRPHERGREPARDEVRAR